MGKARVRRSIKLPWPFPRVTRLPEQRPQVGQHAAGLHLCKVVAPEQTCETVGVKFADRARRSLRPDVAASCGQAIFTFRLSSEIQCGDVLAPAVPMQQLEQPGDVEGVCGRKRRFELVGRASRHRPECTGFAHRLRQMTDAAPPLAALRYGHAGTGSGRVHRLESGRVAGLQGTMAGARGDTHTDSEKFHNSYRIFPSGTSTTQYGFQELEEHPAFFWILRKWTESVSEAVWKGVMQLLGQAVERDDGSSIE